MSETREETQPTVNRWLYWGAWLIAIALVVFAIYLGWRVTSAQAGVSEQPVSFPTAQPQQPNPADLSLPELSEPAKQASIFREINLHTIIPTRPRQDPQDYTVDTGDSVFAIAKSFGLEPESVLWANYVVLNDNPDQLTPGMELKIPPIDGVLYEWQEGDTLQGVADRFEAKLEEIIGWTGNKFDLTNPEAEVGSFVMVPGGHREFKQWIVPTIPRGRAGVSSSLYGGGTCAGGYEGAYGSGAFIWPADNHSLSGNDYWSGHLAIDIAAGTGARVYAADSGVVVFAGSALGGYGNMIMVDHGNGYQTLYAHLGSVGVSCGQSVIQGQYIGSAGNTGYSTGPHLHFEVRYLGGFVNPWFVLPAP
ncbi:MAG: LysM peptidoglycan-binding domain-containing M23 family metallopeptidase [Chloroflexota bacterium]|nr:MAG: LysM peptidoglycan-binding domain-containing M23 family metallopeptidase [Chloroflexota bacterium]